MAVCAAAAAAQVPAAVGSPYVQAHRGGAVVAGKPTYPENTMPAFRSSIKRGFVLELDVRLSADDVPVVFHDATLERASDCEGRLAERTRAELRECRVDILGTNGNAIQLGRDSRRAAAIPGLARVLRLVRRTGGEANIEINNVPTEAPSFDPTGSFARTVAQTIARSGVPRSRLIVQSFWPPNLEAARQELPDVELSLLTLSAQNDGAPAFAAANDIDWVSPQWPVSPAFVANAHALGRRVVPFTIDDRAEIVAAYEAGVDAIITNDPLRARRAIRAAAPPAPAMPPPPSRSECRATRASTHLPPAVSRAPRPGAPRVHAMQFKQDLRNVVAYESFRTKIECMIRQYVRPRMAKGRPDVVAFNEDVGLMTIATGSRGASARALFENPETAPSCESQGAPCGALAALAAIDAAYAGPLAAYRTRFPQMGAVEESFVAPTDTFARGWMQTFSDMARRYGVYIVGSNTQAEFRESRDPSEIAAFRDPDLPEPDSVYVATGEEVYNEVFMWGPRNVRAEGPRPLRNVVVSNRKVPLTPLEEQLEISSGPSTGADGIANVRPYRIPRTRARVAFATSLPAFVFGHGIGEPPPAVDPCSDTSLYYMRCVDRLGANLVIQDEANPGRWAALGGQGAWQPLEWMTSTWRHVADRSVSFDYNVTPFMVGNLADLPFDGQTAITQRARTSGRRCTFIGNVKRRASDPAEFRRYARPKRRFLAISPWVLRRSSRQQHREMAARLAPGSGDPRENDYVETAIVADLPFPPLPGRRGCVRTPR